MFKKQLFKWLVCAAALCTVPAFAEVTNPEVDCSDEVLRRFFPKDITLEVLKKHNVPQDKWEGITNDLQATDGQIIKALEERVKPMMEKFKNSPEAAQNSDDPALNEQKAEMVQFFRDTITNAFAGVLNKYGITDQKEIQAMLDEIQELKFKRFEECGQLSPQAPG
jgi:hypothetical protein